MVCEVELALIRYIPIICRSSNAFYIFFFLVKNIWLFLYVFKFYALILACCMFFLDELQIRFFCHFFFQLKYFLLEHFFS
jgi:hypothetical protein